MFLYMRNLIIELMFLFKTDKAHRRHCRCSFRLALVVLKMENTQDIIRKQHGAGDNNKNTTEKTTETKATSS